LRCRHALVVGAESCDAMLAELGAALEALSLPQAASESGYSADHLAREVRVGRIPNAGRRGAPRIRRGDLPRKPGRIQDAFSDRLREDHSIVHLPTTRASIARAIATEVSKE